MSGYGNYKAYKSAFENVDKLNQVIMLYDTAIASLQQAKKAIADKDIQERFNKVAKAYQIVSGLRDSLDFEKGGEVASVLKEWYSGTALRIISINRTQDVAMLDLCVKHLKEMRDTWVEAEKIVKGNNSQSEENKENPASENNNNDNDVKAGGSYFEAMANSIGHLAVNV